MGPEALAQVLRPLAEMFDPGSHPELLRGLGSPDDACVWRLDDERALVLTADFFPPVVDDPYHYGAIAAANSLSDLYAMGARPLMGLNLVGFPEGLDPAILSEILRGGADKAREAGAVIAGGHTTSDKEPKYGLAVTGIVHPGRMLTKDGARPGDRLLLTKALGTGVITTAHKSDDVDPQHLDEAIASMSRLHRGVAEIVEAREGVVHAATDITGFALAGHAHEMAEQSGLALRLDWSALPFLPGAKDYSKEGRIPGGGRRNREYYSRWVSLQRDLADWEQNLLYDPQTSGGLLLAVAAAHADNLQRELQHSGEPVWRIGRAVEGKRGTIEVA
jgi:selenide,water dikinase